MRQMSIADNPERSTRCERRASASEETEREGLIDSATLVKWRVQEDQVGALRLRLLRTPIRPAEGRLRLLWEPTSLPALLCALNCERILIDELEEAAPERSSHRETEDPAPAPEVDDTRRGTVLERCDDLIKLL